MRQTPAVLFAGSVALCVIPAVQWEGPGSDDGAAGAFERGDQRVQPGQVIGRRRVGNPFTESATEPVRVASWDAGTHSIEERPLVLAISRQTRLLIATLSPSQS